jgi:hypothetical protein
METLKTLRRALVLAAVSALILSPVSTAATSPDGPIILRHPALGAIGIFGTCPDVELPPAGTVCVDTDVSFGAVSFVEGGGTLAPKYADWYVEAVVVKLEFTGADEPIATVLRTGSAFIDDIGAEVAVDALHLQTASAEFVLPMSDGTTLDFSGTWTADSDRQHYGVDGPATGLPRHYSDPCLTVNAHGHQKFTFASMSGTLNGQALHSYTASPFAATIYNNRFEYVFVTHGDC